MADRAGRRGRRQGRRSRPLRAGARAPLRRAAGAHRRDARQPAGPAQDQPDRRARARHPRRVPGRRAGRGAEARAAAARRAAPTCAPSPLLTIDPVDARDHDDAVHAAPDDDPQQQRRLHRARGHRRRRPLRAARHPARPRGAAARQLGLLPRPRRADAARAHLQRPVLAEGGRGARPASPCAWCSTSTATRRATPSCAP